MEAFVGGRAQGAEFGGLDKERKLSPRPRQGPAGFVLGGKSAGPRQAWQTRSM